MGKSSTFKIVQICSGRQSVKHLQYFVYMVVQGPKGGKYLLDLYNIELILSERFGRDRVIGFGKVERLLLSYGLRHSIMVDVGYVSTSDKDLVEYAKHIKAVPVVRKKSRTHYYTLLNKIDFGDMVPMEVCQV